MYQAKTKNKFVKLDTILNFAHHISQESSYIFMRFFGILH